MSAKNAMSTIGTVNLNREDSGWITAQEVATYLANKLGFPILCDFKKFGGKSPFESYVRMRVGMKDSDCRVANDVTNVIDNLIDQYSTQIKFRKSVLDVIEPFMYPQDEKVFKQIIANVPTDKLYNIGLCGKNLEDVWTHAKPVHFSDGINKYTGIYLRPERILEEMCIDPADDNGGVFHIDITDGDEVRGIRWQVSIRKPAVTGNVITSNAQVTLNTIFKSN